MTPQSLAVILLDHADTHRQMGDLFAGHDDCTRGLNETQLEIHAAVQYGIAESFATLASSLAVLP